MQIFSLKYLNKTRDVARLLVPFTKASLSFIHNTDSNYLIQYISFAIVQGKKLCILYDPSQLYLVLMQFFF